MSLIEFCIDKRFCGPPRSGNGGYVCGTIAKHIDELVEVRLMAPPPLETTLELKIEAQEAHLQHKGSTIATAEPCQWDMAVPSAPNMNQAHEAEKAYIGFKKHSLPTCFVCGPQRKQNDGLRIFAGKLGEQNMVAAVWQPQNLPNKNDQVNTEFIWAALDCPGYFAVQEQADFALLGAFSVKQYRPVHIDKRFIICGWPVLSEGRKHLAGTAIYSEQGELIAQARATWISVSKEAFIAV